MAALGLLLLAPAIALESGDTQALGCRVALAPREGGALAREVG